MTPPNRGEGSCSVTHRRVESVHAHGPGGTGQEPFLRELTRVLVDQKFADKAVELHEQEERDGHDVHRVEAESDVHPALATQPQHPLCVLPVAIIIATTTTTTTAGFERVEEYACKRKRKREYEDDRARLHLGAQLGAECLLERLGHLLDVEWPAQPHECR